MALWPFDSGYYQVPVPIFLPVSRRYWLPNFWQYNLMVVSIEIVLFGESGAAGALVRQQSPAVAGRVRELVTRLTADAGRLERAREAVRD